MNREPDEYIRVQSEALKSYVATAAQEVGLPRGKAELLADLLARNDRRGVFSHGTELIATYSEKGYARMMRDGDLNPDPTVEVIRESPVSILMDGDGGLGYFPAYEGTQRAIEKANEQGIAAMATRNHGHFGAAGIYAQEAVEEDLLAFVTSGHQLNLSPGDSVFRAGGRSPMAFCAPSAEEDPVILDFGTMHDLYPRSPHQEDIAELAPGLVLRHLGLGSICQSWGGLLTGLGLEDPRDYQEYAGANQGTLVVLFRIDLFSDPDRFKREVDTYVRRVSELEPLEGFDEAMLPGGPEAAREREFRDAGVPVGPEHQTALEDLASNLGLTVPWETTE